jgi:hypothetical protein
VDVVDKTRRPLRLPAALLAVPADLPGIGADGVARAEIRQAGGHDLAACDLLEPPGPNGQVRGGHERREPGRLGVHEPVSALKSCESFRVVITLTPV